MSKICLKFLLAVLPSLLLAQESHSIIGFGFDIHTVDALNWEESAKGALLKVVNSNVSSSLSTGTIDYHFVTNPFQFEEKLLSNQTIQQPYLAINSNAHYKPLLADGSDNLLFVYTTRKVGIRKVSLTDVMQKQLDSAFVEDFRRLGRDITPYGFISRYGTHYAHEVLEGGQFIRRNSINVNDYIYSPYDKEAFQKAAIKDIQDYHTGNVDTTPFVDCKESLAFTQGGNEHELWPTDWTKTVSHNPKPIDASLVPITHLLRNASISDIEEKEIKLQLLDSIISNAVAKVESKKQKPIESKFYKKYSLQFKQEIKSIVKTSMGKDDIKEKTFTGDIFFGGFSKDEAILRTAPLIDRGGLRLETLITDEKVIINKNLLITIKPEDIATGYVSVWDDTKKLFKSNERSRLRVSGPIAAHTSYQEALRRNIKKQVRIETIDKDVYEIEYTLELEKQPKLISNFEANYNYVLDSEVLAAVTNANVQRLDSLFARNGNVTSPGIIEAIIINKHSDSLLNYVLDRGTIPTTKDLDLLFEREHFDEQKVLILLERGAQPKNNMIYKAVAYKSPRAIYALFREGATTQNNDLNFALKTKFYPTIKAIMSEPYETFTASQPELLLAAQNNDEDLARQFVKLNARADASVLDVALQHNNENLTNVIVPVTEPSNETLVVVAKTNNTDLFSYFISKNARIDDNKAVEISIDNGNTNILDLALKNGGNASKALSYAIAQDHKPSIKVSLDNKASPDKVFAYAAQKNDEQLFNETLNYYGGNPNIALDQAVRSNKLPLVQSVLINPSQDINPTNAIALAVSNENLDMVKLLVENKANPTDGMSKAVSTENILITQYLIRQGAQSENPDLIKEAVKKENIELSKVLIEQGNAKVDDAIIEASITGNAQITKYLLEKGARAQIAFESAMETKNEEVILLLMNQISQFSNAHLTTAARKGNKQVVKKLLEKNLDPSLALINAVNYRKTEVIKLLLENGAIPEPNLLKTAVSFNYFEGIEVLLKFSHLTGNTRFDDGEYPVHIVAQSYEKNKDYKILGLLLANGADINTQNNKGETALHLAAIVPEKDIELITILLEFKANPTITNNEGLLPMDYAIDKAIKSKLRKAVKSKNN